MEITGIILTVLMGVFLFISGLFVTFGTGANAQYELLNLSHVQSIVGVDKMVSVLLFLNPATFMIGAFLLVSFWGGAIVAHMAVGEVYFVQSIFLVLTWLIIWLRRPEVFRIK